MCLLLLLLLLLPILLLPVLLSLLLFQLLLNLTLKLHLRWALFRHRMKRRSKVKRMPIIGAPPGDCLAFLPFQQTIIVVVVLVPLISFFIVV